MESLLRVCAYICVCVCKKWRCAAYGNALFFVAVVVFYYHVILSCNDNSMSTNCPSATEQLGSK